MKCDLSYACILKFLNTFCLVLHAGQSAPVHIRKGLPCEGESFPSLKRKVIVFST